MNKFIIGSLLLVLVWACQEESELITVEDNAYLVYDLSLECQPLETEDGFFFVALKDSIPWVAYIDQQGNCNSLIDLSSYLPSDITYDSLKNLTISQLASDNIIVAFSYIDTESENSQEMIQALEIQQSGTIVDELWQPIPANNNQSYSYVCVSKSEASDWLVVSSYSTTNNNQNIDKLLYLQTTVYKNTDSDIETESSIQSFNDLSVIQSYTLTNNNMLLFLSESQTDVREATSLARSFTILNISTDAYTTQKVLNTSFSSINVVKQVDDDVVIVGTTDITADESTYKVLQLDNSYNTLWENSLSIESNFIPTCIQLADSTYVLGGIIGEPFDLNWNSINELPFTKQGIYSFDYDGILIWNTNQESEFSTLIVGACQSDDGYSWLLAKKSFNTYSNIAIVKTSFEGSFN